MSTIEGSKSGLTSVLSELEKLNTNEVTTEQGETSSGCNIEHRGDDNKDEIDMVQKIFDKIESLQSAISVPLATVVETFNGDQTMFRNWVKNIERYSALVGLDDSQIPRIAHVTSSGTTADFIQRYLDQTTAEGVKPSWTNLNKLLKRRFGEIIDSSQALSMLRQINQKPQESVQMYAERFLQIAEDAYPRDQLTEGNSVFIRKQLTDTFIDGLAHDYLKIKLLRDNPANFEDAFELALAEQNLRKRVNIRSENHTHNHAKLGPAPEPERPTMVGSTSIEPGCDRVEEEIDISHLRKPYCHKCSSSDHTSRGCSRLRQGGYMRHREPYPRSRHKQNFRWPSPERSHACNASRQLN